MEPEKGRGRRGGEIVLANISIEVLEEGMILDKEKKTI
jgi:hypothetical protein